MKPLDRIAIGWLTVANAWAFLAFLFDKWSAGRAGKRVSEFNLVALAALGGWPGGWLAMVLFRHKTVKRSFRIKFWLALIPFGAVIYAWQRWR